MKRGEIIAAVCLAATLPAAGTTDWELLPIHGGGYVMNVIFTRNPQVAYMTVDVGGPYRSDDGLRTWRPLHAAMSFDFKRQQLTSPRSLSVDPRDENSVVVAAGNNPRRPGGIIVSRDGGRTWRQTAVANYLANGRRRTTGQLLSRNPWNPDELVTGGDCSGLLKSTDNGETWRPVGDLKDRWFTHVHHDLAVKGRVWACAPGYEDMPLDCRDVKAGREPNPVPRYGRRRGLYRSDDGGETWTELLPETVPAELGQISGDTRVIGLFGERAVKASTDGGVTWTDFADGLDRLPSSANVWDNYGCQRGVFRAVGAGSDFYLVSDTRGNVFRRSRDEPAWREVKAKSHRLTNPGTEMRDASHKPAACSVIVDPRDDAHWLVTDWYTVWETTDAGANWRTRIAGAQQLVAFTVAASPFDPDTVFYATADSQMYVTHDGGKSYVKTQEKGNLGESVNSVAFSHVTPGLALVTGGKFHPCVRVTRDNGRTWRRCGMKGLPPIRPDLGWTKQDGFYAPYSVVAHPARDEFYLAMGGWTGEGKGGVYRSTDAGETWEWFGQGLGEHKEFFKFQEWGNGDALAVSESGDLLCWPMGGDAVYRRGPGDAAWTKTGFSMCARDAAYGYGVAPQIRAVPGRPGWFFANCGPGDAALYCSADGGRSFSRNWLMTGLVCSLACDAACPGTMLVACNGKLFVTRDFGASFAAVPGGFDNPCGYEPRFFVDRGRMWVIGGGSGCWTRKLDADAPPKPWVVVNEDCSTTIAKMAEDELCEAGLRRHFAERLLGPRLTHYAVNPQAMCAGYDSKVATPLWRERQGGDRSEPKPMPEWIARLKAFHERGIDPFRIWMACAREHGVKAWISMRMNDVHCVEAHDRWMCSELWFARPDLRREPTGNLRKWHGDSDGPFDYSKPEVFDYHLAYLQELVDRYGDVADGIECDWLRFPHHLPLGRERECAAVLTAFMRKVRAIADARAKRNGRPFVVAVRVASSVEGALGLGTDAVAWAREGLVDVVTPCNFFNVVDFDATWSDWKRLLGEANAQVRLLAGMDDGVERRGLWLRESINAEEAAGYFARALEAGVTDGVNLFNYFLATKDTPVYRLAAFEGLDVARVNGMTRRFACTWRDALADDTDPLRPFPAALDRRRTFRFDLPAARSGDRVIVHVRRRRDAAPCAFPLEHALMNGTRPLKVLGPEDVEFPLTAVKRGENVFSVGPAKGLSVNGLELELSVR